jgi:hypothetical protein
MHWPCEFIDRKGRRCVIIASRHAKIYHQSAGGKFFGTGPYYSPSFNATDYMKEWMNDLKTKLLELQGELQILEKQKPEHVHPLRPVRDQHLKNLSWFYRDLRERSVIPNGSQKSGACRFKSHGTCLCCLMRAPEYALRCGHVLCAKCVAAFSNKQKTTFEISSCPLHGSETQWSPPWKILTKPKFAGVRILTLDG